MHQIIADDAKINEQRFSIEDKCIALTATQQPMANDLRIIVVVLSIIIELERIGDYAEGNCQDSSYDWRRGALKAAD